MICAHDVTVVRLIGYARCVPSFIKIKTLVLELHQKSRYLLTDPHTLACLGAWAWLYLNPW